MKLRHLSVRARRTVRPAVYGAMAASLGPRWLTRASVDGLAQGPLVVSGFMGANSGIGSAGRLTADALERAGWPVARHDLGTLFGQDREPQAFWPSLGEDAGEEGGVWVLHCNPQEAVAAMARLPNKAWAKRYRIGYWAWETPRAPAWWRRMARHFHEIWTPSKFVADALAGADAPIVIRPHPVPVPPAAARRERAGAHVLAMADMHSSAARKNPEGALELYRRAFPTPEEGVRFTLKLRNADAAPQAYARLRAATGARADIELVVQDLDPDALARLTTDADVFVSPHRAEGFGLAIAEALASGAAVLATGWSGNMTFMSGLTEQTIPYALTGVEDDTGLYRQRRQMWAQPDLATGARLLRRLCLEPDLRARAAAAGRDKVAALAKHWTPQALRDGSPWSHYVAAVPGAQPDVA